MSPAQKAERRLARETLVNHVNAVSICDEILFERHRQQRDAGYSPDHDDGHTDASLAEAAECYVISARAFLAGEAAPTAGQVEWPWEFGFNPKNARADLVRAAALIVAEIERLDRASARGRSGVA